jgi:hypothetical protein
MIRINTNGDLIVESNTNGDYWCNELEKISENIEYTLLINADNGIVKTYLNNTLISTTTPTDDITLSKIVNSTIENRINGVIQNITLFKRPLTELERQLI